MNLKLNIGCGGDIRPGYVNIDRHSKDFIETRYGVELGETPPVFDLDILHLPYQDSSVDEVLCLAFLEHLSFEDEGKFLREVQRVLRRGGTFHFTVPDFENLVKQWLAAEDNFIDFYKLGTDEHWFGNGDRNLKNRWGYLTASIFGNQYGEGQFHKNAFTRQKIVAIMQKLGFMPSISTFNFKNTEILMLECVATKL